MRFELDDLSDAIIQADIYQVAYLDFAAEFGGAVHAVFLNGCFPNAPGYPGASVKNPCFSFSPAATLSAGKLIRCFALHTQGSCHPSEPLRPVHRLPLNLGRL